MTTQDKLMNEAWFILFNDLFWQHSDDECDAFEEVLDELVGVIYREQDFLDGTVWKKLGL